MKKLFSNEIDAKTLTLPLALEREHPSQLFTLAIIATFGFIALSIVWVIVTTVSEVTHASGQLQPSGSVQNIQHLEGGYIDKIFVREGQRVTAGQELVRLRPVATQADRDQLQTRIAGLSMAIMALDALSQEKNHLDLDDWALSYPELASSRLHFFRSESTRISRERVKLQSQLDRRLAELTALQLEKRSSLKRESIALEQLSILQGLLKQKYASRRTVLDAESVYEEARSRQVVLTGRIAAAKEAVIESQSSLQEQLAATRSAFAKEKASKASEYQELKSALNKQKDRVASLRLIAPSDGIIQELAFKAVGSVVKGGDIVAKIVPNRQDIIAEVRVNPKDIGHVQVGAIAKVTVSTFDPYVYGTLDGIVETISASTFLDERGEPYYKVNIDLGNSQLIRDGQKQILQSGMIVLADIVTGEKSLARYLLKPVYRSLDQAFSER